MQSPSRNSTRTARPARAGAPTGTAAAATAGGQLAERLRDQRVCICTGAGGVGKTTIAAAIALALARDGRRVLVLTIDPARRLADVLGLPEARDDTTTAPASRADLGRAKPSSPLGPGDLAEPAGGRPRRVSADALDALGIRVSGELWAMTLDVGATFAALVAQAAPNDDARRELLANRVYRELARATAGSHEVAAVAALYELHERGDYDMIVLDTPPSRDTLDFLDAPGRLAGFLESRAMAMFIDASGLGAVGRSRATSPPAGNREPVAATGGRAGAHGGSAHAVRRLARDALGQLVPDALGTRLAPRTMATRLVGGGTGLLLSLFARATGVEVIGELGAFFGLLSQLRDGLHERARAVERLLRDPATTFLIVTSPEPEPVTEALHLHRSFAHAGLAHGPLIVNKVHHGGSGDGDPGELKRILGAQAGTRLATLLMRTLAELDLLVRRDRASIARLTAALDEPRPIVVAHMSSEIVDLGGVARLAACLEAAPG